MSWDDWSASNQPPIADDDKWHVALAPGEVKIVSLEQLDDLYRLSIVDAETKVWQSGMGEWQPLRVIAGIDEEPVPPPAPKRTHPKPPSPRSAPPPPRPVSVAPVPAAAFAATVPASFYPAAINVAKAAPAPISFAAPVVPLQLNSVRPLVVSRAPVAPERGGGFGRFLVGIALVAGVGISLYRNDVIRDAAHSAHQDALYTRLEGALGGPAFGTLRSVDSDVSAASASLTNDEVTSAAPRPGSGTSNEPSPSPSPAAPGTAAQPSGGTPPVVSLESLTPEKKALAVAAAVAPAAVTPIAARSLAAPSAAQAAAAAQVKSAPAPKPPAAKIEKPAPAPEKSEARMNEREKLNAAIGRSMLSTPPSSKSKSKASEYDPLNPKL